MNAKLYILRHAIAEERDAARYPDDSLRPLTARGTEKMREIAGGMKAMGLTFDLILSSPFLRARQTAEIVLRELKTPERLALCDHLMPGGDPASLMREVAGAVKNSPSILLVGHEPYLSALVSMLVSGGDSAGIIMKKGGLCALTLDAAHYARCATLEWLLTPRQLRRMAP